MAPEPAKFEIFPAADGYRWRLKAANGEVVAQSEAYTSEPDAHRGAEAAVRAVLSVLAANVAVS